MRARPLVRGSAIPRTGVTGRPLGCSSAGDHPQLSICSSPSEEEASHCTYKPVPNWQAQRALSSADCSSLSQACFPLAPSRSLGPSPPFVPASGPLHSLPPPPGKPFSLHCHRACHFLSFRSGLNATSSERPSHPEAPSIT